ncbi:MAG: hypothetical protein RR471_04705 [Bacteroides sp.]
MRYRLPTDKLINRLVPYYLSGRKYILLLQSMVYPLQSLNDRFVEFAREKHLEARMTSQIIYFEWYLNHKFSRYFANAEDRIFITESTSLGVDIYHEDATNGKPFTVWIQGEEIVTVNPLEEPREFYRLAEEKMINKVSFMVNVPSVTITTKELVYMLSFVVNTYKVAGKTYLIKIDGREIESNNNIQV